MKDELRILLLNSAEGFRALGRKLLDQGDRRSAGEALAVECMLRDFQSTDRADAPPAVPFDKKPEAPATVPAKRGRKPKDAGAASVRDTEPPPPPAAARPPSNGNAAAREPFND